MRNQAKADSLITSIFELELGKEHSHKVTITQTRQCPECEQFLELHPSLRVKDVTNQHLTAHGWKHTTQNGRTLHAATLKRKIED